MHPTALRLDLSFWDDRSWVFLWAKAREEAFEAHRYSFSVESDSSDTRAPVWKGNEMKAFPKTWGIGSIQHENKGTRRAIGSGKSTAGVVELHGPNSGCSRTSLNPCHLLLGRIIPWKRCLARLSKVELLCSCSPVALLLLLLYNGLHVKLAASLICLKH